MTITDYPVYNEWDNTRNSNETDKPGITYDITIILRCPVPRCQQHSRTLGLKNVRYKYRPGRRPTLKTVYKPYADQYCPVHIYPMEPMPLRATRDDKVACGIACQAAIGNICVCSCAGTAHGTLTTS